MSSDDRDILISRVIDGIARDHDWGALDKIAEADPAVWRELAQVQRQNSELTAAVGRAVSVADDVELDAREAPVVIARVGGLSRWGGWAAAAALALAWIAGSRLGAPQIPGPVPPDTQTAGLLPSSAADALKAYLSKGADEGLVLGEMPTKVMLDAVPVGEDERHTDVYYIRQIVERVRVEDLYRASNNEAGAVTPTGSRIRFIVQGRTY